MLGRKPVIQARITNLLQEHHLLSAPQILEKMASEGHKVNKTSVYRALEKLLAAGTVCKQIFSEDILLYELRTAHHDHLVCENCGIVETIPCHTHTEVSKAGFIVSHHHMTVFGQCENCLG